MHDIGCAYRGAGVVRRGGNEHVGEFAGLPDQVIGHAIERYAPGKAQIVDGTLRLSRRTIAVTAAVVASCSAAAISACCG